MFKGCDEHWARTFLPVVFDPLLQVGEASKRRSTDMLYTRNLSDSYILISHEIIPGASLKKRNFGQVPQSRCPLWSRLEVDYVSVLKPLKAVIYVKIERAEEWLLLHHKIINLSFSLKRMMNSVWMESDWQITSEFKPRLYRLKVSQPALYVPPLYHCANLV